MSQVELKLDPAKTYQTMEGFGASGAWWAQLVGGWPGGVRGEILKLLYNREEGLGLGIYRYNLGGGSKESGRGSYSCPRRRASDFLAPGGGYDWSRDAQAVWCMKEAVRNGADEVVLFVNSPPERWTVSGMAQGKIPFRANLRREHEVDFTRYVLDVAEHFLAEGMPVKFISPINEPCGPWTGKLGGQEGCHYHPAGMRRLLRLFAREMGKRPALKGVLLSGAEHNDLRYMNRTYTRAVMGDRVIRTRLHGIDVHGYALKPLRFVKGAKRRFRGYMDRRYPGQPIRMTEWTEMRGGRDCGMESALVQARAMAEDLSVMNAVSWQHWIAVSEYDFCDGLLYIDAEKEIFEIPKRHYAFGNFSKFISRGAVRIGLEGVPAGLQALAFDCRTYTAVILINHTGGEMGISLGRGKAALYETNEAQSLEKSEIDLADFSIQGQSVNTVVMM